MGLTKDLGALPRAIIVDSSNRVGIGTQNPETKTHFLGTGITTTAANTKTTATTRIDVNSFGGSVGIGQNSLNQVLIQAFNYLSNTAEAITLNPYGGRVGVGTQSPQERFVVSNLGGSGIEFNPEFLTNTGRILSYNRSTSGYSSVIIDALDLSLYTNGSSKMNIFSNGNVFIGSSPVDAGFKLDVNGTTRSSVFNINSNGTIQSSGFWGTLHTAGSGSFSDWALINSATNGIMYNPTGTLNMVFAGNVGIGTISPAERLSVNGNVEIQGIAGTTRYILTNETNTGTGRLVMQAGGGSAAFGGALNLYANAHPTFAGDVVIGLSANSTSKFRVNSSGLDGGTDLFTILRSNGNVLIGTTTDGGYKLDVAGQIRSLSATPLVLSMSTNAANDAVVASRWTGGTGIEMRYNPNNALCYFDSTYPASGGFAFGDIQFRINSASTMKPVMTIKANNLSVGIGVESPQAKLHNRGSFVTQDGNVYGEKKSIFTQSVFNNPTIGLITINDSSSYGAVIIKVTIYHTTVSSGQGVISVGYANWASNPFPTVFKSVINPVVQASFNGGTNVGTLSWSGNTLNYTSNRMTNYDGYTITVEYGGNSDVNAFPTLG